MQIQELGRLNVRTHVQVEALALVDMALAGRGHADRPVLIDQERRFVVPDRLLGQVGRRVGDFVCRLLLVGEKVIERVDAGRRAGDDRRRAVRRDREHPGIADAVPRDLFFQSAPLLGRDEFAFALAADVAA